MSCVRAFAMADGHAARAMSQQLLEDRHYERAIDQVNHCIMCFEWAEAKTELVVANALLRQIEISRSANHGDEIIENIAAQLKPVYPKEFDVFQEMLREASSAFTIAEDEAGLEMVRRMRRCVGNIEKVDQRWNKLVGCLARNEYAEAVKLLEAVRHFLIESTNGLPFVNPR